MDEGAKHSSRAVSNSATRWGATSLLAWLNESLDLDGGDDWSMPLQDLKETATGGVFCQIFDASFPNVLALKTVVWGSKGNVLDYEVTSNLRLLSRCLHKVGLTPPVEFEDMSKAPTILQFLQWLRNVTEQDRNYPAKERRTLMKASNQFGRAGRRLRACASSASSTLGASGSASLTPERPPHGSGRAGARGPGHGAKAKDTTGTTGTTGLGHGAATGPLSPPRQKQPEQKQKQQQQQHGRRKLRGSVRLGHPDDDVGRRSVEQERPKERASFGAPPVSPLAPSQGMGHGGHAGHAAHEVDAARSGLHQPGAGHDKYAGRSSRVPVPVRAGKDTSNAAAAAAAGGGGDGSSHASNGSSQASKGSAHAEARGGRGTTDALPGAEGAAGRHGGYGGAEAPGGAAPVSKERRRQDGGAKVHHAVASGGVSGQPHKRKPPAPAPAPAAEDRHPQGWSHQPQRASVTSGTEAHSENDTVQRGDHPLNVRRGQPHPEPEAKAAAVGRHDEATCQSQSHAQLPVTMAPLFSPSSKLEGGSPLHHHPKIPRGSLLYHELRALGLDKVLHNFIIGPLEYQPEYTKDVIITRVIRMEMSHTGAMEIKTEGHEPKDHESSAPVHQTQPLHQPEPGPVAAAPRHVDATSLSNMHERTKKHVHASPEGDLCLELDTQLQGNSWRQRQHTAGHNMHERTKKKEVQPPYSPASNASDGAGSRTSRGSNSTGELTGTQGSEMRQSQSSTSPDAVAGGQAGAHRHPSGGQVAAARGRGQSRGRGRGRGRGDTVRSGAERPEDRVHGHDSGSHHLVGVEGDEGEQKAECSNNEEKAASPVRSREGAVKRQAARGGMRGRGRAGIGGSQKSQHDVEQPEELRSVGSASSLRSTRGGARGRGGAMAGRRGGGRASTGLLGQRDHASGRPGQQSEQLGRAGSSKSIAQTALAASARGGARLRGRGVSQRDHAPGEGEHPAGAGRGGRGRGRGRRVGDGESGSSARRAMGRGGGRRGGWTGSGEVLGRGRGDAAHEPTRGSATGAGGRGQGNARQTAAAASNERGREAAPAHATPTNTCPGCSKAFKDHAQLAKHVANCRKGKKEQAAREQQQRQADRQQKASGNPNSCPDCGRSFNPEALARHLKICQKVFQSKRPTYDANQKRLAAIKKANKVKDDD